MARGATNRRTFYRGLVGKAGYLRANTTGHDLGEAGTEIIIEEVVDDSTGYFRATRVKDSYTGKNFIGFSDINFPHLSTDNEGEYMGKSLRGKRVISRDTKYGNKSCLELDSKDGKTIYLSKSLRSLANLKAKDRVAFAFDPRRNCYFMYKATNSDGFSIASSGKLRSTADHMELLDFYGENVLNVHASPTTDSDHPDILFYKLSLDSVNSGKSRKKPYAYSDNLTENLKNSDWLRDAVDKMESEGMQYSTKAYTSSSKVSHNLVKRG